MTQGRLRAASQLKRSADEGTAHNCQQGREAGHTAAAVCTQVLPFPASTHRSEDRARHRGCPDLLRRAHGVLKAWGLLIRCPSVSAQRRGASSQPARVPIRAAPSLIHTSRLEVRHANRVVVIPARRATARAAQPGIGHTIYQTFQSNTHDSANSQLVQAVNTTGIHACRKSAAWVGLASAATSSALSACEWACALWLPKREKRQTRTDTLGRGNAS